MTAPRRERENERRQSDAAAEFAAEKTDRCCPGPRATSGPCPQLQAQVRKATRSRNGASEERQPARRERGLRVKPPHPANQRRRLPSLLGGRGRLTIWPSVDFHCRRPPSARLWPGSSGHCSRPWKAERSPPAIDCGISPFRARNGSRIRPKIRSTTRSRIGRIVGPFAGRNAERIRAAVVRQFAPFRPRPPRLALQHRAAPPTFPVHALATMR